MRNLLGHNCKVAALFEGTDCWFCRLDSILLKVKAKLRNKIAQLQKSATAVRIWQSPPSPTALLT